MLKRAVSNIEMILSFLLFIGFVFVALFFFSPSGGNSRLVDSSLNYALSAITENTSIPLLSYSIKINTAALHPPGNPPEIIAIQFPSEVVAIPDNYNVYSENYSGSPLQATRSNIDRSIVYLKWAENKFVVLRFSEDFTPGDTISSQPAVDTTYYSIASSSNRNIISEKRILALNDSYYLDYVNTKNNLNLPAQVNFGFNLKYDDGNTINAQRDIPVGLNVFSTLTHRETTLQGTNTLAYGDLAVQIW